MKIVEELHVRPENNELVLTVKAKYCFSNIYFKDMQNLNGKLERSFLCSVQGTQKPGMVSQT